MSPLPVFLEKAGEDDLAALLALERRCFSHPWSEQGFRGAMEDPHHLVLVLRMLASREIAGYAVLQVVSDELTILDLAVTPELRGRGLGRRLLSLALGLGARRGATTAHLEVRESNWPARRLYQALGFRAVGVRRGYYEAPVEDALVLAKGGLGDSRTHSGPD